MSRASDASSRFVQALRSASGTTPSTSRERPTRSKGMSLASSGVGLRQRPIRARHRVGLSHLETEVQHRCATNGKQPENEPRPSGAAPVLSLQRSTSPRADRGFVEPAPHRVGRPDAVDENFFIRLAHHAIGAQRMVSDQSVSHGSRLHTLSAREMRNPINKGYALVERRGSYLWLTIGIESPWCHRHQGVPEEHQWQRI